MDNCLTGFTENIFITSGNNNVASNNTVGETSVTGNIDYQVNLNAETDSFASNNRAVSLSTTLAVSANTGSTGCEIDYATKTITPASALAAGNNNNYDTDDATTLRLTGDAGGTSVLTGVYAGSGSGMVPGRRLRIINVGTPTFTITYADAASNFYNRILNDTAGTFTLTTRQTVELEYDGASSVWRAYKY
jgi:hypothetical protein